MYYAPKEGKQMYNMLRAIEDALLSAETDAFKLGKANAELAFVRDEILDIVYGLEMGSPFRGIQITANSVTPQALFAVNIANTIVKLLDKSYSAGVDATINKHTN